MAEEITPCDMSHGNKKRHSPNSTVEAYCYQLHDNLQLLYGFSLFKVKIRKEMKTQINILRLRLDELEANIDSEKF